MFAQHRLGIAEPASALETAIRRNSDGCGTCAVRVMRVVHWTYGMRPLRKLMIVETITIVGIAVVLAALILVPESDTYAAESDAGNRIGLRIDHVELTRDFLSKLEIKTPTDSCSISLDEYQALFVDEALRESRQGNVFARPKVTYRSGEVVRFDIPSRRNERKGSQVWDAEHGSKFTLTPTLTRPGIVDIALRPSADDARMTSVAVPSGHATAFVLEANARHLRLLIVRPHIY